MKLHLSLLLLIPAVIVYGKFTIKIEGLDILTYVNKLRRQYAIRYNVPDMHELIWSNDLVDILKPLDWSLSWPEARITWRYMYFYPTGEINAAIDIEGELISFFGKTQSEQKQHIEDSTTYSAKALELLNPLQRFIGCGPKKDGDSDIIVCLIGRKGYFNLFDTSGSTSPGSKCYKRYKKIGRLCVAENPDRESYYSNAEYFLDDVNDLRRDYANRFNVPNMHELIWSYALVKILIPLDWTITQLERHKTWRYMNVFTYDDAIFQIERYLSSFFDENESKQKELIKDSETSSVYSLEWRNPLQRFVGCSPNQDIFEKGSSDIIVCLIGTRGDFKLFDTSGQSSSSPGSKCHKRYKNIDGLCVAENPNKESYYSRSEYFLEDVNALRREYANRFNVPNMHELIWSIDLERILKHLDWSLSWPEARFTWRYMYLYTYTNAIKDVEEQLNPFLAKTQSEQKQHIEDSTTYSAKALELLNPLQRFIGCGPKREGNSDIVVCLIGTSGDFKLFDTSGKSSASPGSKCYKRYKNIEGICVAENPKRESYQLSPRFFLEDVNDLRRDYAKQFNVPNMHDQPDSGCLFDDVMNHNLLISFALSPLLPD